MSKSANDLQETSSEVGGGQLQLDGDPHRQEAEADAVHEHDPAPDARHPPGAGEEDAEELRGLLRLREVVLQQVRQMLLNLQVQQELQAQRGFRLLF